MVASPVLPAVVRRIAGRIQRRTGLDECDCLSITAEAWWRAGMPTDRLGLVYVAAWRDCVDEWRRQHGRPGSARAQALDGMWSLDAWWLDVDGLDDDRAPLRADLAPPAEDGVDARDLLRHLRACMDPREWDVIASHDAAGEPLRSIGARWGVTESRACQIATVARAHARAILQQMEP